LKRVAGDKFPALPLCSLASKAGLRLGEHSIHVKLIITEHSPSRLATSKAVISTAIHPYHFRQTNRHA
jgi:hypothetical protein